jgi:hypothetical protein
MHRTHRMTQVGLAVFAALVLTAGPALGDESEDGGAPGGWLSDYVSARAVGLGGAFVGCADDASAVVWNPAGLATLVPNEVRFETARLFEDTSVYGLNFAVPGNKLPTFGLSILSLQSGSFDRTNELNDPLGSFNQGETAYIFTVARNLSPRLSLGSNIKMVHQSVEDYSANGFGFDVGALYDVTPTVRVGAALVNIGGPSMTLRDTKETYPLLFRGGFSAVLLHGRGLLSAEIDQSQGDGVTLRAGSEYWVQPSFALRLGVDDQYPAGGMSYRFSGRYQFDYGVLDNPLGMTHRLALTYRFGGFFATAKAEPQIFSPTGETAVTKIEMNARTKGKPENWSLMIVNKSEQVVRQFGGKGAPPAHLLWDGKDETGLPLPDGIYRYTLEVHDAEGRQIDSQTKSVEIYTGGPQGSVPVIPIQ